MKILICGLGSIGLRHTKNLLKLGYKDILLFTSRKIIEKKFKNLKKFNSLTSALQEKPNLVLICNSTHLHEDTIITCLKKNTNIFIEKPVGFNKKKLEAEDFAILNMKHNNGIISSLAATTRANKNYESSIDVILENKRLQVSGVSLNEFKNYFNQKSKMDRKKSESFSNKKGIYGAMGTGHYKILVEFLSKTNVKSSKDLELYKNLHVLEILHSVYKDYKREDMKYIKSQQSILGKNEK